MSESLRGLRIRSTATRTLATFIVVSAWLFGGEGAAAREDRLVLIDSTIGMPVKDYRALLRRKLWLKPRPFARMLYLPFADGEAVVSVYAVKQRSESRPEFYVVYTKAEKNIWAKRMEGRVTTEDPGASAASVRVTQIKAPLPTSTAHAVHDAWVSMLLPNRIVQPTAESRIILDGSETEFFVDDGTHTLQGALPAPRVTGDALRLLRIGQMLISYCEADPRSRAALAAAIERKSQQIVVRVQR
jgi:hypothetical protein